MGAPNDRLELGLCSYMEINDPSIIRAPKLQFARLFLTPNERSVHIDIMTPSQWQNITIILLIDI
jgi:hypothetical protein